MAATPSTRVPGVDGPASRTIPIARRDSTETRKAFKTTEFFAYLAVLAGVLIAGLAVDGDGKNDWLTADKVWLYATILTAGYAISRGLAKAGSYEPEWERTDDTDRS